ncbi:HupE/UreJ family protein [Jannaschia ovalis]|uniref:HupE/UreJ family protein n=1 Tax=Jannaschia ovalis TaxID=3038773 RepID=A0ABY8LG10_9RHOB|nr:HupE/UreJ family protein [Jannaschia sp. GRR-S6-38]WGH80229.1 HupE/UreJ family protein [Jannaschia sp. GRR-S6-38]
MDNLLRVAARMVLALALSIGATITASAHEVEPSFAEIDVDADRVTIRLRTAVEPLIAGIDLGAVQDTNDSPLADRHDRLRELPPEELAAALTEAWSAIDADIILIAGDAQIPLTLAEIDIPPIGNPEIRRDSELTLTADLPPDDAPVIFGFDASLGNVIVRQVGDDMGEDSYEAILASGSLSDPLPRAGAAQVTAGAAFLRNVVVGFEHIIPAGLDHILFVLGLYFYALHWRPLLWQVTSFTLAHTVTLALATLGVVNIPGSSMWIVETVIAASIVWVAIENIWSKGRRDITWERIGVVFVFGLLHGLGFASVFSEAGMAPATLIASLVAFNIGVEIGQLAVIAIAFLVVGAWFGRKSWYRPAIAIPGSIVIAVVGAYWVLNRIGLAGDLPYLT